MLEEYLEGLEEKEGPKVVTGQDTLTIPDVVMEEELKEKDSKVKKEKESGMIIMDDDEIEIIWCPSCGKMTSAKLGTSRYIHPRSKKEEELDLLEVQ